MLTLDLDMNLQSNPIKRPLIWVDHTLCLHFGFLHVTTITVLLNPPTPNQNQSNCTTYELKNRFP